MMRGFLLSVDAVVATILLLLIAFFVMQFSFTYASPEVTYHRMYLKGRDILNIMEDVKITDLQSLSAVSYYTEQGILNSRDQNKSLLDAVGSLWAGGNTSVARDIIGEFLDTFMNETSLGYRIRLDNTTLYERNKTRNLVSRLSTIVSGYDVNKPVSGYVASASLERISKNTSKYVYFGGYVGDGNITRFIELPADVGVKSAEMEMDVGNSFDLYINSNHEGTYQPSTGNMSADNWTICEGNCTSFVPGNNTINLTFIDTENNFIGGGFLKVEYNTSIPDTLPFYTGNESAVGTYWFPGIAGTINLFSSLYIPGAVNKMEAYLHYNSSYTTFVKLGNTTIHQSNQTGEQEFVLNDSELSSVLDYSSIGWKTLPLRFGLSNISYVTVESQVGDTALVTDVSGSMDECAEYAVPYICNYYCVLGGSKSCEVGSPEECTGNVCEGSCFIPFGHYLDCNRTKLDFAEEADKDFVDVVLNESYEGNNVSLVSYESEIDSTLNLTSNKTELYNEIENYTTGGGTCICCGINRAVDMLVDQSEPERRRSIVVMSDGEANVECDRQDTGDPKNDTIQAACDAYENYNITVYTVGFGSDADEDTLNQTAQCGNGEYWFSNVTELAETFREIAEDIVNASYFAQTVEVEGNMSLGTELYMDSHISYNYTPENMFEFGEVSLTRESDRFGGNISSPKTGGFSIPDTKILDSKVTSYSSQYWTDTVDVNSSRTEGWESVFELGSYGSDYTNLGDPYIVNIPTNTLAEDETNYVSVDTGVGSGNNTGGSPDDRAVYSLGVSGLVGYGDIFSIQENATQDAEQRLEQLLAQYGISLMESTTSSQSIGGVPSMWGPVTVGVEVWI